MQVSERLDQNASLKCEFVYALSKIVRASQILNQQSNACLLAVMSAPESSLVAHLSASYCSTTLGELNGTKSHTVRRPQESVH